MTVNRKNRYFSLAAKRGNPLGTMWYATTVTKKHTGDFYITNHARHSAREVDYQPIYFSLHLPKNRHTTPAFFLRIPRKNVHRSGLEVATSFPLEKGTSFPAEQIDDECWRVVRLTWSYRLQQEKYDSVARSRFAAPILEEPNDGFVFREKLPPNSYWKIDFILSRDSPYTLPGEALGLASSLNGCEAVTHLRSDSCGKKYFLTSVSSITSDLRRPIPDYCQAPPSAIDDATMVSRMGVHDSGFYWAHEIITSMSFKNNSKHPLIRRSSHSLRSRNSQTTTPNVDVRS